MPELTKYELSQESWENHQCAHLQRLCEKKQRQMHEVVAFSAVMLNETLEDVDVGRSRRLPTLDEVCVETPQWR